MGPEWQQASDERCLFNLEDSVNEGLQDSQVKEKKHLIKSDYRVQL